MLISLPAGSAETDAFRFTLMPPPGDATFVLLGVDVLIERAFCSSVSDTSNISSCIATSDCRQRGAQAFLKTAILVKPD